MVKFTMRDQVNDRNDIAASYYINYIQVGNYSQIKKKSI